MPETPTVALATCRDLPDLDVDEQLLLAPLADAGVHATVAIWDDTDVDWARFDLVVVRSTWDYAGQLDAFLAWARSVDRLANPADVLTWNTDKRYLRELDAAGVPVVDTEWLEPGDLISLPPSGEIVVKPAVSAGSLDTGRYDLARQEHHRLATAHAERLLDAGRTVMVQPYLAAVDVDGERSLLFVGGAFSHSATKSAMLAGPHEATDALFRAETITAHLATDAELALARATLAAVPGSDRLLYARVDLVDDDRGAARVLEVEVTEPSMFMGESPGSAERFAAAIAAAAGAGAQRRLRS